MNLAHIITLLSPIYVPIIISALLFFQFEKRTFSKIFLGFFMLNIAMVFIGNFYYFNQDYHTYAQLHPIHIFVVLMIYPGIYTYSASLVNPKFKLKSHIGHYLPALFYLLTTSFIFFLLLGNDERIYFLSEYRHFPNFDMPILKTLFIIRISNMVLLFGQIFYYGYRTLKLMQKHKQDIENTFSSPEKFQLNWIKSFNLLFFFTAMSSIGFYAIDPSKVFGNELILALPLFCFSLAIWFLGIMGINQQPYAFEEEEIEIPQEELDTDKQYLFQQISAYFESNKPYLNSELKIFDLCKHIGSNRTYISNAINDSASLNFSAYVNTYRIEEAKRLIKENPLLTFEEVGQLSGFGSVSSFTRAFKAKTGVSPKMYNANHASILNN